MKKNLMLMLGLVSIVLLVWCGKNKVENIESDTISNENNVEEWSIEYVDPDHPNWVAVSLSNEDLDWIDQIIPPLWYYYQTYDSQKMAVVDAGEINVAQWEESVFSIPEYDNMVNREVINSGIEDDMIYTNTKLTLNDGSVLDVLYVNEPDTLFYKSISIQGGGLTTLYDDFIYFEEEIE